MGDGGTKMQSTTISHSFRKINLGIALVLAPFTLLFSFFFLYPIGKVVYLSFMDNDGNFTFSNFNTVMSPPYSTGYGLSIKLGLISAVASAIPGALIAYIIELRAPLKLRRVIGAMNGVLANTGGIPLAFMFMAALGLQGTLTKLLKVIGVDLYAHKFSLASFTGLVIIYLYFQIPLMVIVFSPAVHALRKEWKEAATNLGANKYQFWKLIGVPILTPSFIACLLLLFASAFAAYATANAVTVGTIPLVPLQIAGLLNGNVSASQLNLGKALAVGMIVISALAIIPYILIQRRAKRWQQ